MFSQATFGPDFEPYLATEIDEARLADIAGKITDRYRRAGFILSYATVPPQDVRAGIVRIKVVEGFVDTIEYEGASDSEATVRAIMGRVADGRPLHIGKLERAIGLLRDLPGMTVGEIGLVRSDNDPARHVLKVRLTRDRARALAYSDNRGTENGARARVYTSIALSSLAILGDELRFDLFAIPGNSFRYFYGQASAFAPIGHDGLRIGLSAAAGDQYQRASIGRTDGTSTTLTAHLSYPVVRRRSLTAVARLSIADWRSVSDLDDVRNQRDRLRVARIGLDLSREGTTRANAELSISQGLGFDDMTRKGDPLASRSDASGRFTKAAFMLQLVRPLAEKYTLRLVMSGQVSDRPLLSGEEFALGGNRIGRAYDFNALTGDHGFAGGAELGHSLGDLKFGPRAVELFGFVDGGAAFQAGANSGFPKSRSLSSVGVGTRFGLLGISFSAEAGVPLHNDDLRDNIRGFISAFKTF